MSEEAHDTFDGEPLSTRVGLMELVLRFFYGRRCLCNNCLRQIAHETRNPGEGDIIGVVTNGGRGVPSPYVFDDDDNS